MSRRSPGERLRARRRLEGERLETADEIAPAAGHPARTVERYVSRGYQGVHLDGYDRVGLGWLTSWPAWVRFCRALAEREECEREYAEELARRGVARADVAAGVRGVG